MFILKYIFFIPFVCPNPSHPSFMWDWSVLSAKWELYAYAMFFTSMIAFTWFYFFSKPNTHGVRRFAILTIFLLITGGAVAYYYVYVNQDILFIENASWTFEHTFTVILSGLATTLILWLAIVVVAYFVTDKTLFYAVGILAGIALGSSQSISRSLMSTITPLEKKTEFFGFYSFFGKASAIIGPLIFGYVSSAFNQRAAILSVGILILTGMLLLQRVEVKRKA
ncbi:MAG: hypothetical protein C0410_11200 [Anaerolinea sp.]|nr:hypothetical protein [Anaerolinea sp.]